MKPVVQIIGGFLGAGKTAAINRFMTDSESRTGVIVNDFGALNIDETLIASRGGDVIGLTNGCVCCTMGDDLGGALARLQAVAPDMQRILVETSGVSDPRKTAQIVTLENNVTPGAVVTVVNALEFPNLLKDRYLHDTVRRQVARADRIMMSHVDIAPVHVYNETLDALRALGVECAHIVLGGVEDHACFAPLADSDTALDHRPGLTHTAFHCETTEPTAGRGPPFWHWYWTPETQDGVFPMDRSQIERWLTDLAPEIVRVKGVVRLRGDAYYSVVQKAGTRHSLVKADIETQGGLVVIGRYPCLPAWSMEQDFRKFLAEL
ncbi:MAG: GTP-binding protein [Acetobacter sp.]